MPPATDRTEFTRTIAVYPWVKFCQNLVFWQSIWFLYFQTELSAAEAILLYVIYDLATTALEVPSGYMSDRLGRRMTLLVSAAAGLVGAVLIATGSGFGTFALGQILLGASAAFLSGTDSALLYETLLAAGREDDIEAQELRAWRFSFVALAMSAVTGGVLSLWFPASPFLASALVGIVLLWLTAQLTEPPRSDVPVPRGAEVLRLRGLIRSVHDPVLGWLFVLAVAMYVFSHIPFVFGQPFIFEALGQQGLEADAPLVSGAVSSVMMLLSVAVSLIAPRLRQKFGLPLILMLAFSMQIALVGLLALTNAPVVIAFLFLRMVPNSLSRPFVLARIQPLLSDDSRATYISLQSFSARLILGGTLFVAAGATTGTSQMPYSDIQVVLGWYVAAGIICLSTLALWARRLDIEPAQIAADEESEPS